MNETTLDMDAAYRAHGYGANRPTVTPLRLSLGRDETMRHRIDIRETDLGWTVYCNGEPWGWVRRGADTETLPAGTYLAVARHPLTIRETGQPLASLTDAVSALSRAEYRL